MTRPVSATSSQFLINLERIQRRLDNVHRQISSGIRLATASDDPGGVVDLLQLETNLKTNAQVLTNLDREKTEVDIAESALRNAVSLLDRALAIGAKSAGTLVTAEQRLSFTEEANEIHANLVGLSRSSVNGRYVFSGDADRAPVYASDPAGDAGVARLQDVVATRQVLEPGGTMFTAGKSAHEIFDARDGADFPTEENVFNAVHRLLVALDTNDTPGIESAMDAIRHASQHLNTELKSYGIAQNRIAAAMTSGHEREIQYETQLVEVRDTDLTAAVTELAQAQLHQQATLAAQAKYQKPNLFDYLG